MNKIEAQKAARKDYERQLNMATDSAIITCLMQLGITEEEFNQHRTTAMKAIIGLARSNKDPELLLLQDLVGEDGADKFLSEYNKEIEKLWQLQKGT